MKVKGIVLLLLTMVGLACPTISQARDGSSVATAGETVPAGSDVSAGLAPSLPTDKPPRANFLGQIVSKDARRVADWVVATGNNAGMPFAIIDKVEARVFVFDNAGRLHGATFALLGRARGDNSVPGIGSRKLSAIRPQDRTTPAGRFVASLGHDFKQDILWIDYRDSISMHRVITGDPGDHRLQRLATASPLDKRITYGCVNVPVKFYEDVVLKTFTGTNGVIYILPEIKTVEAVFAMSTVETAARR